MHVYVIFLIVTPLFLSMKFVVVDFLLHFTALRLELRSMQVGLMIIIIGYHVMLFNLLYANNHCRPNTIPLDFRANATNTLTKKECHVMLKSENGEL